LVALAEDNPVNNAAERLGRPSAGEQLSERWQLMQLRVLAMISESVSQVRTGRHSAAAAAAAADTCDLPSFASTRPAASPASRTSLQDVNHLLPSTRCPSARD